MNTSAFRLLMEGSRKAIDRSHVSSEFADVDRSDQGKASVGPQEQETTNEEGDLARMDTKADPVDSLTASSAGGVVNVNEMRLPWVATPCDDLYNRDLFDVFDAQGFCVAEFCEPHNAALIVTACNAHDALVSQREELVQALKAYRGGACGCAEFKGETVRCGLCIQADEALAKAGA